MLWRRIIGIYNVEPNLFDLNIFSTKDFGVFWVGFNGATDELSKGYCRMKRVSRQRIRFPSRKLLTSQRFLEV